MPVATKERPAEVAAASSQQDAEASSQTRVPPDSAAADAPPPGAGSGHAQQPQQQHHKKGHHNKHHKHHGDAGSCSKGRQRWWIRHRRLATAAAVVAVVAVTLGLAGHHAAQDERVRAAVSDSMSRLNTTLAGRFDLRMDNFLEHLARVQERVQAFVDSNDDVERPGQVAAAAGLRAHHPIIIIPGFVTSGLELWEGEPCVQSHFRQRLWGTLNMAQTLLADRACWLRHMRLDPRTGGDPPGIKLRAAKALEAVDYFVPGYWVFSKLIQSLSDIGYDNNNLVAVPYDWRLPIPWMERRDGFFTRVKNEAELQMQLSRGVKPMLVSHSYGCQVTFTFLTWVESRYPGWVDKHLAGYVNLAGPTLGLPKAVSPLLSGESRETVDMMAGLAVLVEQYLGKQSRAALFRTWGSVMAMLPVGGPKVWGNGTHAPDDDERITAAGRSYGGIVAEVLSADAKLRDAVGKNDSTLLSKESLHALTNTINNWGQLIKTRLGSTSSTDDDDDDADDVVNGGSSKDAKAASGATQQPASDAGDTRAAEDGAASVDASKDEPQKHEGVEESGLKVRFLDVHHAMTALAKTAGEQFSRNLKRWSPAAQAPLLQAKLDSIIAQQRQAAELIAAQRAAAKCEVGAGGAYDGTCSGGSSPDSNSGHGSSSDSDLQTAQDGTDASAASGSVDEDDDAAAFEEASGVLPANPTTTPLPVARDFRLFCLYGIGTDTERGYHYLKTRKVGPGGSAHSEWSVNNLASDAPSGLESGVQLSPDGDGTVPLLSLGALCAGGWRTKRLNPAGIKVVVREYPNEPVPVFRDARGGPNASTHVEILGNEPMLLDLLHIAAGQGGALQERVLSSINEIAAKIPWDEL